MDNAETEEMVEKEASPKKDNGSAAMNVDISLAAKSRGEEDLVQAERQAKVRGGVMVEYLAEGRGELDNNHLVEDVVDMETAAEEENLESEEEASEQNEDEECEADEGATSDQDNLDEDQDEDVEEEENGDEIEEHEEEEGAHQTVDIEEAERQMPPPGEHRFLPDSSARRAMRSTFNSFDILQMAIVLAMLFDN